MLSEVSKDDLRIGKVFDRLREGNTLIWSKQAGRFFIDTGESLTGPSLSRNLVGKLEKEGALSRIGLERYALSNQS